MSTETTDIIDERTLHGGVIFYDAQCSICASSAQRFAAMLRRFGFELRPLQNPEAPKLTGRDRDMLMREVTLVTPDRRVLGGWDVFLHVAGSMPLAKPIALLLDTKFLRPAMPRIYRWSVANRYRISGACALAPPRIVIPSEQFPKGMTFRWGSLAALGMK